jgi:AraC family ethanolamine operon transcriptional activator
MFVIINQQRQTHLLRITRFRNIVEANLATPLKISETCAQIGISGRTLRLACQECLGLSPSQYVRQRRMASVRETLLRNSAARITDVATEFGFFELGRFSGQYRQLYGELPSVTARITRRKTVNFAI